jgi:hypothetical protein
MPAPHGFKYEVRGSEVVVTHHGSGNERRGKG